MDLTDLANALALSKSLTVPRENNSWYGLQETPDAISGLVNQLVAKDPTGEKTGFSTRDEIIAGLGSGLLSGLFKGLGDQEQANTQGLFNQVLLGTGQGQTMAMPEGLSPGLFSQAQTTGAMLKNITDQKRAEEDRKLLGGILAKQVESTGQGSKLLLAAYGGDPAAQEAIFHPQAVAPVQAVTEKAPAIEAPKEIAATDLQTPVGDTYQEVLGAEAKPIETPIPTAKPETAPDNGMIDLSGGGGRYTPEQLKALGVTDPVLQSIVRTPKDLAQVEASTRIQAQTERAKQIDEQRAAAASKKADADVAKMEDQLANQWAKEHGQEIDTLVPLKQQFEDLRKLKTPPSDLLLQDIFYRALTPGTKAIRAEMFNKVQDAQNPLNKLQGALTKVMGGGAINETERNQLGNAITHLIDDKLAYYKKEADKIREIATQRKVNPDNVIRNYNEVFGNIGTDPVTALQSVISSGGKPTASQLIAAGYTRDPATGHMKPPGG